jgi:hypothetical protein
VNSLGKIALALALALAFLLCIFWLFSSQNTEPHTLVISPSVIGNTGDNDDNIDSQVPDKDLVSWSSDQARQALLPRPCSQRLQFIVSSERSIQQAAEFEQRFLQDSRLKILPICIEKPLWVEPSQLNCEGDWLGSGRLGCDLQALGPTLKTQTFSHLVIFAAQGKANVHNGIMYLDSQDTYDVFVHELAHFSGFVDEYPLSKDLASRVCDGRAAPNLVFQQAGQGKADLSLWSSLGDEYGVAVTPARTCDNHSSQAYKPSADITFMEFHDQAYIPPVYMAAWLKRLANPLTQTPAYINFAQLYEGQNKLSQGKYWRQRYVDYRQGE